MFQHAITQLPASYRRDRGVYLAREATAHASNRDPEQAAAVGVRALAIARETQSGRIVSELAHLSETLARWPRVKAAADFRERMREFSAPPTQRR